MLSIIERKDEIMCATFFKIVNIFIFVLALSTLNVRKVENIYEAEELQILHEEITLPVRSIKYETLETLKAKRNKTINPQHIYKCVNPWDVYIEKYAKKYGVNANLIRAIIYIESKGNPKAISKKGAQGLMQLMPQTANFMGISNPMNPDRNIEAGVKYIAWLAYHNKEYDEKHLLWAWNAGNRRVKKNILPRETKNFIANVLLIKRYLNST